jgi:Zn finger protein HypA/HybF involved in hydrogenase expression
MEFNVNDLNDYCSLCNKQQNAVSNLSGKSFQINTIPRCGHKFCDDCIRREFARKRSFLCPKCGTSVTQDKVIEFINHQPTLVLSILPLPCFLVINENYGRS